MTDIPSFVRVLIRNNASQYLCLKDLTHKWNVPGGKIETAESPLAAAARELAEETTLTLRRAQVMESRSLFFSCKEWRCFFILALEWSGLAKIGEPEKFSNLDFKNMEDIACDQNTGYARALLHIDSLLKPAANIELDSSILLLSVYPGRTIS